MAAGAPGPAPPPHPPPPAPAVNSRLPAMLTALTRMQFRLPFLAGRRETIQAPRPGTSPGEHSLSLTFILVPLMALAASPATPRALTPTTRPEDLSPEYEANSPIDSLLNLYTAASLASSPSSIHGMMRNSIETGPLGESQFAINGSSSFPPPSSLANTSNDLPMHQANQLAAFQQPWQAGRQRGPGPRPQSSTSHRERSLTSEQGSFHGGGGPRPRARYGPHIPLAPRPHSRANTIQSSPYRNAGIPAHRSETNLRTVSGGSQGFRPMRGNGRGHIPHSHSPAVTEYTYSARQDFDCSGRSNSPSMQQMPHHYGRRNQSMSTLRGGRYSPHPNPLQMHPPLPRGTSPVPAQGHGFHRTARPRAPSNLSTVSQNGSRPTKQPRTAIGASRSSTPVPKPKVDWYDGSERFADDKNAAYDKNLAEDISDSYAENIVQTQTPEPAMQATVQAENVDNGPTEQFAIAEANVSEVASPSPQADSAAQKRDVEKRLSAWSKMNNGQQETEIEPSETGNSPPMFSVRLGLEQIPEGARAMLLDELDTDAGVDVVDAGSDLLLTKQNGDKTASDILTGKTVEADERMSEAKIKRPVTYRIPSMQFDNVNLSPGEERDSSAKGNENRLHTPISGTFNDEPSLTDGFVDLIGRAIDTPTMGSLGQFHDHQPPRSGLQGSYTEIRRPNDQSRSKPSPNGSGQGAVRAKQVHRAMMPPRSNQSRAAAARPESGADSWVYNNLRPGQQKAEPPVPTRTSSRPRPGAAPLSWRELSGIDEENPVTPDSKAAHCDSAADSEPSAPPAAVDINRVKSAAERRAERDSVYERESKKYEQLDEDYSSPDHEFVLGMDGAGINYLPNKVQTQQQMPGIPRVELTRATGSTGRSLTHSDDSLITSRPLSWRLQEHLVGPSADANAKAGYDDRLNGRKQFALQSSESDYCADHNERARSQHRSRITKANARPSAGKPGAANVHGRFIDEAVSDTAVIPPPVVAPPPATLKPKAHSGGERPAPDHHSVAPSSDSNVPTKTVSYPKTLDKSKSVGTRFKGWFTKFWKSGKVKSERVAHSQSDGVIGV